MSDYFGGQSREDLEKLLRRLVEQGAEGPKVDFKTTIDLKSKAAHAELAKDIASIANTDDPGRLNDVGYLIVGAVPERIVGTDVFALDLDKLQASVTEILSKFLSPLPVFSIVRVPDADGKPWGAIVIPPSTQQPHVHVSDGSGLVKHDWFVRVNDTNQRAAPHDYGRFIAKAVRREVQPLENQVQRLSLEVARIESGGLQAHAIVEALKGMAGTPPVKDANTPDIPNGPDGRNLAARIRGELVRDENAVEEALVTEAMRLWQVMSENTEVNPWSFSNRSELQIRKALSYLEEESTPLATALATIARYDAAGRYTQAVCRALSVIARQPEPSTGPYYTYIGEFRLYPLVLCLYGLISIAAKEQRAELLKQVLAVELEIRDHSEPILSAVQRVRAASELFNMAAGSRYCEPVPFRVRDEFIPRLSALIPGTSSADAFRVAELVIALALLATSVRLWGEKAPLSGLFSYEYDARRALSKYLSRQPDWIGDALGAKLPELLADFDATANKVVNPRCRCDGFLNGALKAYRRE